MHTGISLLKDSYLKHSFSIGYNLARRLNRRMRTQRRSDPLLAFPVIIIFSLCLQTSANHTSHPWMSEEPWNAISRNLSGSQDRTEANTNPPLSTHFSSETTTLEMHSTLQSSTTAQNPTPSPATSALSATAGPRNGSKPRRPMTKEACEDNKSLLLICFIIIAVLVLICTLLFLSTVIIANKLSYLRKAQQGKRRPRSNGDLVATNSLWPMAAGTWQRMPKETSGTELILQDVISGRDPTERRKTEEETEELTKAIDNEQENKEPAQPHKPIVTNFVVEI